MRKVFFILLLYLFLYDFYSVKIQPRACSMPLSWTVVEYHSQSHWARLTCLSATTQSQKAVTAHLKSEQLLPFGFAELCGIHDT